MRRPDPRREWEPSVRRPPSLLRLLFQLAAVVFIIWWLLQRS